MFKPFTIFVILTGSLRAHSSVDWDVAMAAADR